MSDDVRGRSLAAVVLAAGTVAVASLLLDWRLLVPLAIAVPIVTVMALDAAAHPGDPRAQSTTPLFNGRIHSVGWIATSLVMGATFAGVKFLSGGRSPGAAAAGSASPDNLLELIFVGMGAMTVASALRRGWARRVPTHAWLLLVYGVWTLLSVSWSPYLLLSGARAFEFLALGGLAVYGAWRAAYETGFADRLVVASFRVLVWVVVVLAGLGVAFGGLGYERFTFRGAQPNTSASMMLIVILALALHPQRARIARPLPWWLVVGALAFLVDATGSRAYTVASVLALVAGGVMAGLRNKRVGALNLALGTSAATVVAVTATDYVLSFIRREQDPEAVRNLNGRLEIWEWSLENPMGSEVWGVGVAAVRGGLDVSMAPSNAHSAWIDILQTLGVIGLGLMAALVVTASVLALVRWSTQATWMCMFVGASSWTSVTISQPGVPLMLLVLALIVLGTPVTAPGGRGPGGPAPGPPPADTEPSAQSTSVR